MANTTYTNFTTPAIDAAWLNDTNRFIYLLAGDGVNAPINDSDVKNNLGIPADIAAAVTASPGRLIGVQVFTASGTYTPTAGTTRVLIEAMGGGAAGGGTSATGGGVFAIGGGGGAGAFASTFLTSGFSGQAVTIGAGGTGVSGGQGNNGGATTFASVLSAGGGFGGLLQAPSIAPNTGGGIGGIGSIGNVVNARGATGSNGFGLVSGPLAMSGQGANTQWGAGGQPVGTTTPGNAALGFGAGGAGACTLASAAAQAGGNGAPGLMVIYEYS